MYVTKADTRNKYGFLIPVTSLGTEYGIGTAWL